LLRRHAVDLYNLSPRGRSRNDADVTLCDAQSISEKFYKGIVRRAINWCRSESNAQRALVLARCLAS
jgi:hypothetical protein